MTRQTRLQCAAILLLFLMTANSYLACADRNGTFDGVCGHYVFHFRPLRGAPQDNTPKTEIVLSFGLGTPEPLKFFVADGATDWNATGKLCPIHSDHCEDVVSAKMHVESVSRNGKHASGTFTVNFRDGKHEGATFSAKYHHEGPRIYCE
jgi:hypothetical protein